ncbi:hypothetical protein H5410_026890 [Solanum commersonii]|uniref:Uncharacterized protein n=1 Tax=Solanum commersonii TaxID=4109 RepID=A0A9J5Z2U7_SOLCO|nr:hypothetical protein H5410_026890 [Solanum commersonii]
MKDRPSYRDIRHISVDTCRIATLHYTHLNQEACMRLKIVCSTLLPCKNTLEVTTDRVVLVCRLMKGLQINVWHDSLTKYVKFLHLLGIEEEVHDVFPPHVSHLVDVTKTKPHSTSHMPIFLAVDCQVSDDS